MNINSSRSAKEINIFTYNFTWVLIIPVCGMINWCIKYIHFIMRSTHKSKKIQNRKRKKKKRFHYCKCSVKG